jgi:hypothetical protein
VARKQREEFARHVGLKGDRVGAAHLHVFGMRAGEDKHAGARARGVVGGVDGAGADELGLLAAHDVVVAAHAGDEDECMRKIIARSDAFYGERRAVDRQRQRAIREFAHPDRRRGHAGNNHRDSCE